MKYRIKELIQSDGSSFFKIQFHSIWLGWNDRTSRSDDVNYFNDIESAEAKLNELRGGIITKTKYHY